METKINLDQCQIEESTEEYKIQKLDTQGNFITERLPLYNLTAEEELNADIQVEKNGRLKFSAISMPNMPDAPQTISMHPENSA